MDGPKSQVKTKIKMRLTYHLEDGMLYITCSEFLKYPIRSAKQTGERQNVLEQYSAAAVLLLITTVVAIIVLFISRTLGPFKPNARKLEPYESGMLPIGPAFRRFPVKFYLIAVLFILFDIEVMFFLPFAVVLRQVGVGALVAMAVFIVILEIGHFYAWKKGALEWE
jgi:NADH-quinone oxidoreductase subunit A